MSFVVTAKITFLSGLSCAGTIAAAMRARAATPSVRMTKRFLGPPAWRAARKLGRGAPPPFRTSPQRQVAPAEPALEAGCPAVVVFRVAMWRLLRQAARPRRPG